MGIAFIHQSSRPNSILHEPTAMIDVGAPYFVISAALNVILTLMIVIRLILHSRKVRNTIGPSPGASGLYNSIITILVESCALYAVTFVPFIVLWVSGSATQYVFLQIIANAQVRAI
jgi:hypothetical protein